MPFSFWIISVVDGKTLTESNFPLLNSIQDSLSSVESLQRKHTQFEKALEAQMEKIDEMASFAQQLMQNKHYDSDNITNRCQAVLRRWSQTLPMSATHLFCNETLPMWLISLNDLREP